jgi:hypothetical protein
MKITISHVAREPAGGVNRSTPRDTGGETKDCCGFLCAIGLKGMPFADCGLVANLLVFVEFETLHFVLFAWPVVL